MTEDKLPVQIEWIALKMVGEKPATAANIARKLKAKKKQVMEVLRNSSKFLIPSDPNGEWQLTAEGQRVYDEAGYGTGHVPEEQNTKIESSCVQSEDFLAEQVYDPKNGFRFAVWDFNDNRFEILFEVEKDGIVYVPINAADEVLFHAVRLPVEPKEFGTLENLIANVRGHIHKYLDVSEFYEELAVHYIITSWLFDGLYAVPYLRALGDTGCGKSRLLDVVGGLCYKPIMASGCITPAPIYRLIRKWGGTLVLDESDFRDGSEQSEIVKILNCGIERGRPIIRCDSNDPEKLNIFPDFCPKVFATRKTFLDKALESRCITEVMAETMRTDIPDQLPKAFWDEQMQLRNQLLMFRFKNFTRIDPEAIQRIDMKGIEPRLRQVARSLMVFMVNKPAVLKKFLEFIRFYNSELIEERASSFEGWVVNALFELHQSKEHITASDISQKIDETFKPKNPTNTQKVGKYLKSLKIRTSQPKRIDGQLGRYIEWKPQHMNVLRRRYVTSVTNVTEHGDPSCNKLQPGDTCPVTNVTLVTALQDKLKKFPKRSNVKESKAREILGTHFDQAAKNGLIFEESPGQWRRI